MKGSLMLLVLFCLGHSAQAQMLLCANQNPFITYLATRGVQVYPFPRPASGSVCSSHWKLSGACCDAASLANFQLSQEQAFHQTTLRAQIQFLDAVVTLHRGLHNFVKLRGLIANLDPKNPIIVDLDKFVHFVTHGLTHVGTYSTDDQKCVDLTHSMRRSSVCYVCAGDSNRYFTGGKARISINDCKSVISSCANTWLKLLLLVQGLGTAERIVNTIKSHFPAEFANIQMHFALQIKQWIEATNVVSNLKSCMGSALPHCVFEEAQGVCENLINLHDRTFIESAVEVVASDLAQFKVIDHAVALVLVKLEQLLHSHAHSQWAIGANNATGRKLHGLRITQGNFGDIQVVRSPTGQCFGCISFDLHGMFP